MNLARLPAALSLAAAALLGCDPPDDGEEISEKTRASWVLAFKLDGREVRLPLESFDVFLVEDEPPADDPDLLGV